MADETDGTRNRSSITLGKYLASVRAERRLTLREVEEATSKAVSNAYLSQIENDKVQRPSLNMLYQLSELYGIDYAELMERAGYITPTRMTGKDDQRHGRAATFADLNLTSDEESILLEYLQFIRQRKPSGGPER